MALATEQQKKSIFKAFVGIDFGTDGSGLAYALPDGSVYIHNMWGDTESTRKPKSSVLLDSHNSVICVGTGAQQMYLDCDAKTGWKLAQQFKMDLYDDKQPAKPSESKIDDNDLKQESINEKSITELSTICIAQLSYLKKQAFNYIQRKLSKKIKELKGNPTTGYPEIQFFLTVPAIWSDKAKSFMVEWSIKAGLITGEIPNQLQIVYGTDCAALSIQHAIRRSIKNDDNDQIIGEVNAKIKESKMKKKQLRELSPNININTPLQNGDNYMLVDVGAGVCDITCHEILSDTEFAVAEVVHPTGDKWGAALIDKAFKELLIELFDRDSIKRYMRGDEGEQSYLNFLQYFSESKLSYQNYNNEKEALLYHDIQIPNHLVGYLIDQYNADYDEKSMHIDDEQKMVEILDNLNASINEKISKKTVISNDIAAANYAYNPPDEYGDGNEGAEGGDIDCDDVNEKFEDRDWMVKIIPTSDDDDFEEDYLLSVHNDVWTHLFDVIVNPIINHCDGILAENEMKDAKYIFLVGGFANSKYFQMRMKDAFKHLSVITPELPGLCIVDGAARYGLDANFVKVSRMRKTYEDEINKFKQSSSKHQTMIEWKNINEKVSSYLNWNYISGKMKQFGQYAQSQPNSLENVEDDSF